MYKIVNSPIASWRGDFWRGIHYNIEMNWQLPLFLSIVFATLRGFLDKKLVDRSDPFFVLLVTEGWISIFFFTVYFLINRSLPPILPEMIILGGLFMFIVGFYLEAIKISLSKTIILSSYYLLITMILSFIFLGEWRIFYINSLNGWKNIGGAILALLSMYFLLKSHTKKEEKMERKFLFFISLNILLNGIGTFWGKSYLQTHGELDVILSQTVGALFVIIPINLFKRNSFNKDANFHFLALLDGIVIFLVIWTFTIALKRGPAVLVLPIQTVLTTIFIALIGLFVFNEVKSITYEKKIGLVLGLVGVLALIIN